MNFCWKYHLLRWLEKTPTHWDQLRLQVSSWGSASSSLGLVLHKGPPGAFAAVCALWGYYIGGGAPAVLTSKHMVLRISDLSPLQTKLDYICQRFSGSNLKPGYVTADLGFDEDAAWLVLMDYKPPKLVWYFQPLIEIALAQGWLGKTALAWWNHSTYKWSEEFGTVDFNFPQDEETYKALHQAFFVGKADMKRVPVGTPKVEG